LEGGQGRVGDEHGQEQASLPVAQHEGTDLPGGEVHPEHVDLPGAFRIDAELAARVEREDGGRSE
jgi:hypothetical protein